VLISLIRYGAVTIRSSAYAGIGLRFGRIQKSLVLFLICTNGVLAGLSAVSA